MSDSHSEHDSWQRFWSLVLTVSEQQTVWVVLPVHAGLLVHHACNKTEHGMEGDAYNPLTTVLHIFPASSPCSVTPITSQ